MSKILNIGKRIRVLREANDLSQQQLGDLVGLSRVGITQIEAGDRKVCADELVSFSKALSQPIDVILGVREIPEVILPASEKKTEEQPSIRIDVPQKNLSKFREVLLYLLGKVGSKPNVGETVLYKLLYFMDFNYYEQFEEQLIGATYQKNTYGPTPMEFPAIAQKMIDDGDIEKVRSSYFNRLQTKYLPRKRPDLSKLSAQELEVIDDVIARLSDMNASQISEYSHQDVPWLTTEDGEAIKYESVFYRTSPYSVRDYGSNI